MEILPNLRERLTQLIIFKENEYHANDGNLEASECKIYGRHLLIVGQDNEGEVHDSLIIGGQNSFTGNNNIFVGDGNNGDGDACRFFGDCCEAAGSNHKMVGLEPKYEGSNILVLCDSTVPYHPNTKDPDSVANMILETDEILKKIVNGDTADLPPAKRQRTDEAPAEEMGHVEDLAENESESEPEPAAETGDESETSADEGELKKSE